MRGRRGYGMMGPRAYGPGPGYGYGRGRCMPMCYEDTYIERPQSQEGKKEFLESEKAFLMEQLDLVNKELESL